MAKQQYGNWEPIETLGRGGQSEVYLARSPVRVTQRKVYPTALMDLSALNLNEDTANSFATASYEYARAEQPSELGALKKFKIREGGAPAEERLKKEIAILRENGPNLPRLLDANESEQWMVTEFFPGGTVAAGNSRCKERRAPGGLAQVDRGETQRIPGETQPVRASEFVAPSTKSVFFSRRVPASRHREAGLAEDPGSRGPIFA